MLIKKEDLIMRNMRDLVIDYVDLMGYDADEWFYNVDRILNRVNSGNNKEKWRLTNIMLEATTLPYEDYTKMDRV